MNASYNIHFRSLKLCSPLLKYGYFKSVFSFDALYITVPNITILERTDILFLRRYEKIVMQLTLQKIVNENSHLSVT